MTKSEILFEIKGLNGEPIEQYVSSVTKEVMKLKSEMQAVRDIKRELDETRLFANVRCGCSLCPKPRWEVFHTKKEHFTHPFRVRLIESPQYELAAFAELAEAQWYCTYLNNN